MSHFLESWVSAAESLIFDFVSLIKFSDNTMGPYMQTLWFTFGILSVHSFTYDLIDPEPFCYTDGLCTDYGQWGEYLSVHPNSEERTLQTLINLARMYPDDYLASTYGAKIYGTFGRSWTYDTEGYCGTGADLPYYWVTSINQASRFGQWDCVNCDDGVCGHNTCTNPDRCTDMFGGDCGFGARCDAFTVGDYNDYGLYCSGEGTCGANLCYVDGHCSAIFDPNSRIFGVGFAPTGNGYTLSYVSSYNSDILQFVNYSIPNACHFDERIKIHYESENSEGKNLQFMLQYWNEFAEATEAWVAYKDALTSMSLDFGTANSGFWLLFEYVTLYYPM